MTKESPTVDDLRSRIAQLESENRSLQDRIHSPHADTHTAVPAPTRRGRRWSALSICLIVVGCMVAPLSVVTAWAKASLVDTDRFVAAYAPLASEPAMQNYVIDQTMVVVNENVNFDQLTKDLMDGIAELRPAPRATAALEALQGPAARGMENLVHTGVENFVTSDAFGQAWERALRISHTQLMATVRDDPDALIKAQQDGTIGIQLGPIVDSVKQSLVERGITVASRIPSVNKSIPIAQSDQVASIQMGYRLVMALGTWLPWVSLLFLAAGVVVARHRTRAVLGTGAGFALAMGVLLLGLTVGRAVLTASLPPSLVPSNVLHLLYNTATGPMRDTAVAGVVLGIAVALVAGLAGSSATATRIRQGYGRGVDHLRRSAEARGITTGRFGEHVYAQRLALRIAIALAASAIIMFNRPLNVTSIIATGLGAIGLLIILSLVERPPRSSDATAAHHGSGTAVLSDES